MIKTNKKLALIIFYICATSSIILGFLNYIHEKSPFQIFGVVMMIVVIIIETLYYKKGSTKK
ncbi:hypothetical protein [Clostridium cellulovorans]|uniref:hypothetical protein n=1 Tax=Clostridium cellulovorans TaxID=1493 RepID=UPI0001A97105|nr:hypothetical protein [Clostridium cellulovorans]